MPTPGRRWLKLARAASTPASMLGSRRSSRGRVVCLAAGQEEADRIGQSPLNVGTTGFDSSGSNP